MMLIGAGAMMMMLIVQTRLHILSRSRSLHLLSRGRSLHLMSRSAAMTMQRLQQPQLEQATWPLGLQLLGARRRRRQLPLQPIQGARCRAATRRQKPLGDAWQSSVGKHSMSS